MTCPDFTTIVGLDRQHLEELRLVWPTWIRHAAKILGHPLRLICDDLSNDPVTADDLAWLHDQHTIVTTFSLNLILPRDYPRDPTATTQRERMLTGLARAPLYINTPWFLKLDTDTVATQHGEFWSDGWIERDTVLVAPRWGYTKPGSWLDQLDRWADRVASGNQKPPREMLGNVARSPRIISYAQWGRTDFARECLALVGDEGRLPIPSQDTFAWYCAALLGRGVTRLRTSQIPWRHAGGSRKRIDQIVRESLA